MKILLVDDKEENIFLLGTMLQKNGYETLSAANGAEALAVALKNSPDLIVTDILMPVMDGFTLCREWKKNKLLKKIPFVFYTATYTDPKDKEFALSLGANRFIIKPQGMNDFLQIIRETLETNAAKEVHPKPVRPPEDKVFLKEYNETLVRRLEEKIARVATIEKELREKNAYLEKDIEERRRMEYALKESKSMSQSIIEDSKDGIIFFDGETQEILFGNKAMAEFLGCSKDDLEGRSISSLHPSEEWESIEKEFQKHVNGTSSYSNAIPIIRHDGSILYTDVSSSSIRFSGRSYFSAFFRDITERKRSEKALREAELKFRTIFDFASDGILLAGIDDRKFLTANNAICTMLGYAEEELLKLDVSRIHPEESLPFVIDQFEKLKRNEIVVAHDIPVLRKDGTIFFSDVSSSQITLDGKEYLIGVFRDITERKRAAEALRENVQLFQALFNASPDAIVLLDPHDQNISWPIVDCNVASCNMNGYTREELIGRSIDILNTTVGTPEERKAYLENIRQKGIIHLESFHRHSDGHFFPVEVSTTIITLGGCEMVLGIDRDITERKQIEEALRKSEERLRKAQMIAHVGNWELDLKTKIMWASEEAFRIYGLERKTSEIPLEMVQKIVMQADRLSLNQAMQDLVSKKKEYNVEFQIRWANDGDVRSVYSIAELVLDSDGTPVKVIGVIQDITERKKAEEALRQTEEQYRTIFENIVEGVYRSSPDGNFIAANPAMARILGYTSPEELIRERLDLAQQGSVDPHGREEVKRRIETYGVVNNYEYKAYRVDGSRIWVSENARVVRDEQGRAIYCEGSLEDITERKQAEDTLKESQALYQSFVEHIPAGVFRKDSEGRYIFVNAYFCRLKGLKTEEILGKTPLELAQYELSIENSRPPEMKGLQRTLANQGSEHHHLIMHTGKSIELEEVYPQPDGTTKYFQVVKSPVFSSDGKIIGTQGVQFEITERKLAEEARHVSEKLFRDLFNASPDAIMLIDPNNQSISWPIVDCNDAACKMNGFTREELVGYSIDLLNLEAGTREERTAFMKNLRNKGTVYTEIFHRHKDGHIFPIEVSTTITTLGGREMVLGIDRDITERRRTEEERKESEERYRRLVEFSPDAIAVHSDGKIVFVNPAAITLLGANNASELIGKPFLDIIHPDYREAIHQQIIAVIKEDYAVPVTEQKFIRLDGSSVEVEVAALPIVYKQKTSMQIVVRDISEQKKLQNQLLQTQKIQSIGTLAGGIAHDFNNILGIILAYSSLLDKNKLNLEKFSMSITAINQAVQRGAALVRQILTFARKTDVVYEPMDISEMIHEVLSMLEQTFPKTITFSESIVPGLPFIFADRTQIHQALLNLCINARDAMPNGGSLSIAGEKQTKEQMAQQFPSAEEEAYVCLTVTDTGSGMDEATRQRIFDPFFTTKEKGKGTGLGLSVVYGVVQAHHGFIDLKSELGRGTSFRLFFPVPTIEKQTADSQLSVESFEIGGTETILIVEDEEMLIQMVSFMLESKGYKVLCAHDGLEAVNVYQSHQDDIALVLTDMGLPVMTGIDEFKKLKEINPNVKIIFASGYFEPDTKSELLKDGANGFIQKPYELNDILRIVRQAIDRKR